MRLRRAVAFVALFVAPFLVLFSASVGRAQSGDPAPPSESAEPAPPAPEQAPDSSAPDSPPGAGAEPPRATEQSDKPVAEEPPEVVIAGTRATRLPGSAYVINNKKLERTELDDPLALLQTVPGVYTRTEDGVGLRPNIGIRGTNPNRSSKVALMEDGVPFAPAPYSAPAAYYFPLVTRMYQVRVLKGPATIVYGPQTVGGAVDLLTRPIPASSQGAVDLAVGEYGYGKFHAWYGASNETDGFLLEGVHLRNDGFKELPDGADTGFYRNEWMVKASHAFDPSSERKHELRLKATYSEEHSNETYLGLSDDDFRTNPNRRYPTSANDEMNWNRTAVVLTHEVEPMRKFKITTSVYRNDFHRVWRRVKGFLGGPDIYDVLLNPGAHQHQYDVLRGNEDSTGAIDGSDTLVHGPNDRTFVSQGIQSIVAFEPVTGPISHRIEYGVRLHYDRVERKQSQDRYLAIGGNLVPDGSPTVVTEYNEQSTEAASLYVIDAVSWKGLTLTPGVRIEFWRSKGINKATGGEDGGLAQIVLPGIGGYYAITEELGVLAGSYRGFSPPVPPLPSNNASGGPATEPGLGKSELGVNYEAGVRYAKDRARADLIGFYNDYSNLTDVCTQSSGCLDQDLDRQFDAGAAKIYGLEAYAEHEPGLGSVTFPLNASYTLTFAEFLDTFESGDPMWGDVVAGDAIPYVPRHQFNALAGVETGRVGGYAMLTYVASMREEAGSEPMDESLHTDEQFVVDVGAHYQVLDPLDLYLNVRNLFDSQDILARRPFGARPNAPRWVQVGAKVKF